MRTNYPSAPATPTKGEPDAALALALALTRGPIAGLFTDLTRWGDAAALAALAALGALVYGATLLAFFGSQWQAALRRHSNAPRPSGDK